MTLAPEALTDAQALILASGDLTQDRETRHAVASLHMARARQLTDTESAVERRLAAALWAMDGPAGDDAAETAMELAVEAEQTRMEYDLTGDAEALARACERVELALFLAATQPDEYAVMMVCQLVLGSTLMRVYERAGDRSTIVGAVVAMRSAAANQAAADLPNSDFEAMLGAVLVRLYECDGDPDALNEAVQHMHRGLEQAPASAPSLSSQRSNLSAALLRRHAHTGETPDLEQALDLAHMAVAHAHTDDPQRAQWLHNLVAVLTTTCRHTGDRALGQEAHQAAVDGVAAAPAGHALHPVCVGDLANTYALRYDLAGDLTALAEAIRLMAEVVDAFPDGHIATPVFTTRYANLLVSDYRRTGDIAQLDIAETRLRQALTAGGIADPTIRGNLATLLRLRAQHTGEMSALEEGVRQARQALADTAEQSAGRPLALLHAAGLLAAHARRTSATQQLDEAIGLLREAVGSTPPGSELSCLTAANLADALRVRYEWSRESALLAESAQLARNALLATPPGHPELPTIVAQAGSCLLRWMDVAVDQDTVDLAQDLLGHHLQALAEGHPARSQLQALLSQVHFRRHVMTGDEAAMEAAVDLARQASGQAVGPEAQMMACNALALALEGRYRRTGDLDALREGVTALAAVAKALPKGHDQRATVLVTRASLLAAAHTHTGYSSLLSEARAAAKDAVDSAPPGHLHRPLALSVLLTVERNDFLDTGDFDTLRHVLDLCGQILRDPPTTDSADFFIHMAMTYQIVHEHAAVPSALASALAMAKRAVVQTDEDHPSRAMALVHLARTLQSDGQLRKACEAAEQAARHPAATALNRALAATVWGDLALQAGNPALALEGFEEAMSLLPQLVPRSLSRADRETGLGIHTGLGSSAAAAALTMGDTKRAAALLEQARGILLTEGITDRTWLDVLREHDRGLAEEAARLWARKTACEAAQFQPRGTGAERVSAARRLSADRAQLAQDWDDLMHRVQATPGLTLTPLPSVPTVPSDCTVVMVNVAESRSDAIVLTAGQPPRHIELPDLSYTEARIHARRRPSDAGLLRTLGWLWRTTVKPILDELGHTDPAGPDAPRIWWCPTGPLAGLPLHAAGEALDRVVSSYLPTVRSLSYTRGRPRAQFGTPCIVAMPETPSARSLPGVHEEVRYIRARFPDAVVLDQDVTHARVIGVLPDHQVAYFACHAVTDTRNPGASTLMLRDHGTNPFTVTAVSGLRLRNAELAFLSACGTAETGLGMADEGINIAAAFQLAGYRHVIGTLWRLEDDVAPAMAKTFLDGLDASRPDADQAPYALRAASLGCRAENEKRPTAWAAHIHVGA
ncbi:CHAT domain-containing protein [Streptomyces sp. NPDC005571]|uniref:CHAT domain-containing protein n=1 Tax=Streptomyces sp. NPDC005571 TaxID=3156888 RepID=UPI0033A1718F